MKNDSIVNKVKRVCNLNGIYPGVSSILVAVSGGSDSTALVYILNELGFDISLAHCNFKIRGEESERDEAFCRQLASQLNKHFYSISFETQNIANEEKIGIQETARKLRYEWLEKIRQKNKLQYIATAHHADDQAETILLNMIRGGGIRALKGMMIKNRKIIRPILLNEKSEIDCFLHSRKLQYRTDLSNFEKDYSRNKLRLDVIPVLSEINSNSLSHITTAVSQSQVAFDLYSKAYSKWMQKVVVEKNGNFLISFRKYQKNTHFLTFLFDFLYEFGFNKTQFEQLLLHNTDTAFKLISSKEYFLYFLKNQIIIAKQRDANTNELVISFLPFNCGELKITKVGVNVGFKANLQNIEFASISNFDLPLLYRPVQIGDYFYPLGMGGKKKKVLKFLKDLSIPPNERANAYVLETKGKIIWVVGYRLDERFKVKDGVDEIVKMELNK